MKKIICMGCICFLCAFSITGKIIGDHALHAQDENVTSDDPFSDVEIVTEENAVPLDKNAGVNQPNAAMGDGQPDMPQSYTLQRSSTPYWKNENGVKNFYNGYGQLMYNRGSKKVIDVSEHQGTINWQQVKDSGVDGAIIRIGWGYDNLDTQAYRNISECNRLGIPYGIYIYSYAYDANFAYYEAISTVNFLKKANINLSFPIYYDIEKFNPYNDNGNTRYPPSTTKAYEQVIGSFITYMNQQGYTGKVHVYSYRSMLNDILNSSMIHQYVSWAAEYGTSLNFTNRYYNGIQGWQYTSDGSVSGISGRVDLSCFGDYILNGGVSETVPTTITNAIASKNLKYSGGYVSGFKIGSSLSDFANAFKSLGTVTTMNSNGTVVSGGIVKTGQRVRIEVSDSEKYTIAIVIRGDLNGDGRISAIDYVKVRNKLDGISSLSGAGLKAGDVNNDGRVSAVDYVKIRNQLDGRSSIKQ